MDRSFVGREKALIKLRRLLEEGRRLVSVCGPEGIGKSRFVHELAQRDVAAFEGGVYITNLSGAQSHDDVLYRLGTALDIDLNEVPNADYIDLLGEIFAARGNALWIADNYEVKNEFDKAAIERWLELAPELQIVVTARSPFKIEDETRLRLGALRLPQSTDFETLIENEAVRLFALRAKAMASSFSINEKNINIVRKIVETLDGVPMAIELAAARVSAFSPAEILERLPTNVRLWQRRPEVSAKPKSKRRRNPSRQKPSLTETPEASDEELQQSMRRAVEWAWDLLNEGERSALSQLSVFGGPFTREAALHVIDSEGDEAKTLLMSLYAKSLLEGEEGSGRLSMAPGVKRFAKTKLPVFDRNRAKNRHAFYYLERATRLTENIDKHGGVERRRELEQDTENLLAVARAAIATEPRTELSVVRALETLLALEPILSTRGPYGIHLSLLDAALEKSTGAGTDRKLLARAHESRGRVRRARGMLDASLRDFSHALEHAVFTADHELQGRVRANIGTHFLYVGDFVAAQKEYDKALLNLRQAGARMIEGRALSFFGRLHERRSQLHTAIEHFNSAIDIHRDVGDTRFEAITLMHKGKLMLTTGKVRDAIAAFELSQRLHRKVGNTRYEGIVLKELARAKLLQKKVDDASVTLDRALLILRRCLDRRHEAEARVLEAEICLAQSNLRGARENLERAETLSKNAKDTATQTLALAAGAALDVHLGALDAASSAVRSCQKLTKEITHADTLFASEVLCSLVEKRVESEVQGEPYELQLPKLGPLQKSPVALQLTQRVLKAIEKMHL